METHEKVVKRVQEAGATGTSYREIQRAFFRTDADELKGALAQLIEGPSPALVARRIGRKTWLWTPSTIKGTVYEN